MNMRKSIQKYIFIWFALLICGSSYGQRIELKVGSYNIRYDNQGDRDRGDAWETRLPVISSIIGFLDYDVVGCQEVLDHQLQDMRDQLPEYREVGVGRDDGKTKGEYAPIFYKKDKFTLLDSGVFWLSETPDRPSVGWDASLPRICTYVHLEDTASGKKLWYFNLHMDHVGEQARQESSQLVVDRIQEMLGEEEVAILTGDFNVDQHNPIYQILDGSGIISDSYGIAEKRHAWNGTFNAFDSQLFTESRIDHVFVSPQVQVKHYAVLTESYRSPKARAKEVKKGDFPKELSFKDYESRLPSDHFPIVVRVLF